MILDENTINAVTSILTDRIEETNTIILEQIGNSIKQIGTLTPTKAQQLAQILKYGGNYDKIAQALAQLTELNINDIYVIFENVAKQNQLFAKQFYDYKSVKFIPYEQNIALQNQVKAIATITANTYMNMSRTLAYTTKDTYGNIIYTDVSKTYQNAIDRAILNVGQGKDTFQNQMYSTLKELGQSGLKTVDYVSGRAMRLDSAIRMNMQGGLRDMSNELQQQFGKEFGADGVEISVHSNPAVDHSDVQRKTI